MQNVRDIIALWPDMVALERDIQVPYQTISSWKRRNSVQKKHWKALIEAAQRRGFTDVSASVLMEIHASGVAGKDGSKASVHNEYLDKTAPAPKSLGHFSRYRAYQKAHYASLSAISEHIAALRDEWDR